MVLVIEVVVAIVVVIMVAGLTGDSGDEVGERRFVQDNIKKKVMMEQNSLWF